MARPNRRGAQAVEFALIMPIFVALLSGVVDMGWFFQRQSVVATIVREAARAGSLEGVNDADDEARDKACRRLYAAGVVATDSATCSQVTATVSGAAGEENLTVNADVPFVRLVGLLPMPSSLGANLTLRIEQ